MRHLLASADSSQEPLMNTVEVHTIDASDLADRYDLLAIALWHGENPHDALKALRESEAICDEHGIEFDGANIRRDILEDLNDPEPG